ncbi:unnamed protein product [Blepharisma stoltei]|uniref:HTH La-type RNA-binding domain-containing protein n=1 Tax=Blepharisma stoltei TaxID=1481888 RepID=A0AAU9JET2_9CILI|nr:unnamed protein product [Blepharisma stoltei]
MEIQGMGRDLKEIILKCYSRGLYSIPFLSENDIQNLAKEVCREMEVPGEISVQIVNGLKSENISLEQFSQTSCQVLEAHLKNLQKVLESYFIDNNLKNNGKLLSMINKNPQGFVSLLYFLSHKNIKNMTTSVSTLALALKDSKTLELSADKSNVKRIAPLPEPQGLQSSFYHLDTSQTILSYKPSTDVSIFEPLNSLPHPYKGEQIQIASNLSTLCYYKESILYKFELPSLKASYTQSIKNITTIDIRQDSNILIYAVEKKEIIIVDLANFTILFSYNVVDGTVEGIVWHPTEQNMFASHSASEVTVMIWKNSFSLNAPDWFKVLSFGAKILSIALAPNNPDLLAVALGQGKVLVVTISDENTIFNTNPHTYNTMMYSPNITVNFLTNTYLLTSGRSQNEFCIFSIENQTKLHTLAIQSMTHKKISVIGKSILIAGINDPFISLVNISEINDCLMFSSIIDYKLSSNIAIAALSGSNRFSVINRTGISVYSLLGEEEESKAIIVPQPEQPIEKEPDENSMIDKMCDIVQLKMNKVSDKINNLSKLLWVKTPIQDWSNSIFEENLKNTTKVVKTKTKEASDSTVTPAFQSSVNEILLQVTQNFDAGIKDFNEKDSNLLHELEIINREYEGKLTLFDDIIKIFTESCNKHMNQLKECEETMNQRVIALGGEKKTVRIQEEVNVLLAKGEFEEAVLKVIKNPKDLYAVLKVMNPRPLLASQKLTKSTVQKIINQIETLPPLDGQLPEKQTWLESLSYYRHN